MNCESWLPPKNSRIAATTGRMLIRRQRRELLRVADAHALAHHALHAQQADAQLVLDQLAHRLDAAVAQMVDVVGSLIAVVDQDHALDDLDQVALGQSARVARSTFRPSRRFSLWRPTLPRS